MYALAKGTADRVEQELACLRHAATDDDSARANRSAYICCCYPEGKTSLFINIYRDFVACLGGSGDQFGSDAVQVIRAEFRNFGGQSLGNGLHAHRGDGGTGCVGFHATVVATTTAWTVEINCGMAKFAARPADAEVQLSVDHQSAADASANGEDGHGVHAAPCTEAPFTVRDGADVVEQSSWKSGKMRDRIPQGDMRPGTRQIGKKERFAFFQV